MSACLYNVGVLWANGWTDRYESWHAGSPGHGHTVLDGDPAPPPPNGGGPPIFDLYLLWPMAGWITMPLGREIDLSPSDIVLDRDPAPLPEKGTKLRIFGPCLLWPDGWMDQDATWRGGTSRLRPHCARWGPSSPPPKGGGALSPIFGPRLLWLTARWMKMPLSTEVDLSSGHIVLDGDPAPPAKGAQHPPSFRPMSIVATVAHRSYCWALVKCLMKNY